MIIFDCDGVLVDTETLSNRVLAEAITEAGYPMTTRDCVRLFKGGRIKSLPSRLETEFGLTLRPDFLERFFDKQLRILGEETKAIPGIHDVLAELDRKGRRYCVASQASVQKMRVTLGKTGLWARFEAHMFSADMVAHPKPAPDLFLHAAATLGWRPDQVTVVEDSVIGVQAAVASGMRVIGFARDTNPNALTAVGATHIAEDMKAVASLL